MKFKYSVVLECGYTLGGPYKYVDVVIDTPQRLTYRALRTRAISVVGGDYTCFGIMQIKNEEWIDEE